MHDYIRQLKMEKHIEGGYFRVNYRSSDKVMPLHPRYQSSAGQEVSNASQRNAGSAIYFLLEKDDFSAWHRIKSDEIWHFYDGCPVNVYVINPDSGEFETHVLGNPCINELALFQVVLPAGCWFAAELMDKAGFALMGCTVSPAFEYYDWELADKSRLLVEYPDLPEFASKLFRTVVMPPSSGRAQNQI